ncbi:MAG: hypothetical protein WB760_02945, partial [Xanthobacteraceae bacterium]
AAGVSALLPSSPVMLGISVHMSLAIIVGILLASAWRELREQWPSLRSPYSFALAALAGIWALNRTADCQPGLRSPGALHCQSHFEALIRHRCCGGTAMAEGVDSVQV